MRFFPNKWQIELRGTENPISLTKVQREFLLTLVKNAKQLVSYDDLRRAVWSHEPEVDQRLIHNMHVTKSKLIGLLDARGVDSSFIESIDGEGYRLNAEVIFYPARHEKSDSDSGHVFNTNTVITVANMPTAISASFSKYHSPANRFRSTSFRLPAKSRKTKRFRKPVGERESNRNVGLLDFLIFDIIKAVSRFGIAYL
jgi:DNA-binding winged helix-turn-helix (wHTH) protein